MRSVHVIEERACSRRFQVHRNRPNIQPGENAWGFGQIISLVLIFGSLIDIVVTIRERRMRESGTEGSPSQEDTKSAQGV